MQIALMGKSRSGKDTVAHFIRKHSTKPIAIVGFGDALKEYYTMLFPNGGHDHMKPREGYEKFGEGCRQVHEDVWVDKLDKKVQYLKEIALVNNFVITDLRQPNEWNWCFENGYTIIKVEAPDVERTVRSFGTDSTFNVTNHSERFIDELEYDFQITNDGSLEQLELMVIDLLKILGGQET